VAVSHDEAADHEHDVDRCRNLVYVSFCYCEHITDAGVELMGHMPSLISLDLTGCCLTDQVCHVLCANY